MPKVIRSIISLTVIVSVAKNNVNRRLFRLSDSLKIFAINHSVAIFLYKSIKNSNAFVSSAVHQFLVSSICILLLLSNTALYAVDASLVTNRRNGQNKQKEAGFVAVNSGEKRMYVQSAWQMPEEKKIAETD